MRHSRIMFTVPSFNRRDGIVTYMYRADAHENDEYRNQERLDRRNGRYDHYR